MDQAAGLLPSAEGGGDRVAGAPGMARKARVRKGAGHTAGVAPRILARRHACPSIRASARMSASGAGDDRKLYVRNGSCRIQYESLLRRGRSAPCHICTSRCHSWRLAAADGRIAGRWRRPVFGAWMRQSARLSPEARCWCVDSMPCCARTLRFCVPGSRA